VDPELQQYLAQLEGRLATRIDAAEARMESRIEIAETRMESRIGIAETRMEARIEAAEARMAQRIETTETRLLTEFHKWASPTDARLRTHSAAIRAIDLEMEALEQRVSKLEGNRPS
jgi:hypothetical protein